MLELKDIARRLQDRNLTHVARETGLSVKTVSRVKTGAGTNVTYNTLMALSEYLEGR